MTEEKKNQLEEWARIKDMTKLAIETVTDRKERIENWKKNERTELLKTKAECIEWLEHEARQLLAQQWEDEKVKRAMDHLIDLQQC